LKHKAQLSPTTRKTDNDFFTTAQSHTVYVVLS